MSRSRSPIVASLVVALALVPAAPPAMAEARDCVPGAPGCPTKLPPPAAKPDQRPQPQGQRPEAPQPQGQRPQPQGQPPQGDQRGQKPPGFQNPQGQRPQAPQPQGQMPQHDQRPQGQFQRQQPEQRPQPQGPAPQGDQRGQKPPGFQNPQGQRPQAPQPQGGQRQEPPRGQLPQFYKPQGQQPQPQGGQHQEPPRGQLPQFFKPQGQQPQPQGGQHQEPPRGQLPQFFKPQGPGAGGDRRPPPLAAQRGPGGFGPGDHPREVHIERPPVPRYSENRFGRSKGLTNLEAFGLGALAAVTVGALLSNGNRVVSTEGDRVVYVNPQGGYGVYHDDDAILRRPGSAVYTEDYSDGSVLTRIVEPDGTVIVTVRNDHGRVLRRTVTYPNGRTVVLFDDTAVAPPAPDVAMLPPKSPVDVVYGWQTGPDLLRSAFMTQPMQPPGRYFSLDQVRTIPQVRYLVPEVELSTLDFASGSSAVSQEQAQGLATLAKVMNDMIAQNPGEVFLIEGHTDSTGDPAYNLALSDARAEATAMALSDYYGVPPQNLVTQGYGESDLRNPSYGPDPVNRHTIVRRITPLLQPVSQ